MAGYRRAGAGTFTNATTINDQMDRQREDYKTNNQTAQVSESLGVARSTTPLFRMPDDIFNTSVSIFNLLDLAVESGNPDFGSSNTMSNNPGTTQMFNDVADQSDRPNRKGPNLIAPDINDPTFTNTEQSSTQFENRGFGWRDARNNPGTGPARIGEYFSKHYKADGSNLEKPVLGEAKSPASDTNIDYDQP
jgi:hypothetical protein